MAELGRESVVLGADDRRRGEWTRRSSLTAISRQAPATAVTLATAAARLQDTTEYAATVH